MGKIVDITGKRFGKLVAIRPIGTNGKSRMIQWECSCDCGKRKVIDGGTLRNGDTKSCGCEQYNISSRKARSAKLTKPKEIAVSTNFYHRLKQSANARKIELRLSLEEAYKMALKNCHYCNSIPMRKFDVSVLGEERIVYLNGIDRVDSAGTYTKENCVPCCPTCNTMKNSLSKKDFIDHVNRIINWTNREGVLVC